MKKSALLVYVLISLFSAQAQQPLVYGREEILPGTFYVVHSGMDQNNNMVNTSNIYLIKGTADTVWIFGTGYGDRSTSPIDISDLNIYKGNGFEPTVNAIDDAMKADTVIRFDFGINVASAKLMFVVPHFHMDHINKEFVAAFFETLGYTIAPSKILVHVNDYFGSTCNSNQCSSSNNYFRGAPFHRAWTGTYLGLFQTIGNTNDQCNQIVYTFTSVIGNWEIKKSLDTLSGGHTEGAVNLDNAALQYRVQGADGGQQCPIAPGWIRFGIHGNLPQMPTSSENVAADPDVEIFPNPFNDYIFIHSHSNAEIVIYNLLGEELLSQKIQEGDMKIETAFMPAGIYFLKIYSANGSVCLKLSKE